MSSEQLDLHAKYDLTRIINACGKMTHLGGAIVLPEIRPQVSSSLGHFFDLDEIQERAGETIAKAFGSEWGCVTACTRGDSKRARCEFWCACNPDVSTCRCPRR
jgi:seryl-tRNA(Sec) selenium transferase